MGENSKNQWASFTEDAEIARLRAALKPFAEFGRTVPGEYMTVTYAQNGSVKVTNHDFRAAFKALGET